jgi:hypothetical protein
VRERGEFSDGCSSVEDKILRPVYCTKQVRNLTIETNGVIRLARSGKIEKSSVQKHRDCSVFFRSGVKREAMKWECCLLAHGVSFPSLSVACKWPRAGTGTLRWRTVGRARGATQPTGLTNGPLFTDAPCGRLGLA